MPRYTSYPTAPHFSSGVDGDVYRQWLGALEAGTPLSLYMHIPFCDEMCWYCGCFTKIVKRYDPVAQYLDAVLAEIDLVADALPGKMPAQSMHWGGGSPTMLSADDWKRTMETLRARFDVAPNAEIAVEMDPRTTTRDYVDALAACGVNRVSIGVQDFDARVQQAINRVQPFETTARVVGWLRDAGIDALNLDLMYGLPHQTRELIADMTVRALSLEPSRIALFGYAHVPWMRAHQRLIDEAALPGLAERWEQASLAASILEANGYVRVGFDHFAHPDDPMAHAARNKGLRRNFQGYTTDAAPALLGFGASAIGTLPQGYVQNVASIKSYRDAVLGGDFAVQRGIELSDDDVLRRAVIERIMCDLHVDLGAECRTLDLPEDWLDDALPSLMRFVDDDLIEVYGRQVQVLERGRPLVRAVAAAFDAYLPDSSAKHSIAV